MLLVIHFQIELAHKTKQIRIHTLDIQLIQRFGIQTRRFTRQRIETGFIHADTAQLLDRLIQRVTNHFQAQASQMLQLLSHRPHGGVC